MVSFTVNSVGTFGWSVPLKWEKKFHYKRLAVNEAR